MSHRRASRGRRGALAVAAALAAALIATPAFADPPANGDESYDSFESADAPTLVDVLSVTTSDVNDDWTPLAAVEVVVRVSDANSLLDLDELLVVFDEPSHGVVDDLAFASPTALGTAFTVVEATSSTSTIANLGAGTSTFDFDGNPKTITGNGAGSWSAGAVVQSANWDADVVDFTLTFTVSRVARASENWAVYAFGIDHAGVVHVDGGGPEGWDVSGAHTILPLIDAQTWAGGRDYGSLGANTTSVLHEAEVDGILSNAPWGLAIQAAMPTWEHETRDFDVELDVSTTPGDHRFAVRCTSAATLNDLATGAALRSDTHVSLPSSAGVAADHDAARVDRDVNCRLRNGAKNPSGRYGGDVWTILTIG